MGTYHAETRGKILKNIFLFNATRKINWLIPKGEKSN